MRETPDRPHHADRSARPIHRPRQHPRGVTLITLYLSLGVLLAVLQIMSFPSRMALLEQDLNAVSMQESPAAAQQQGFDFREFEASLIRERQNWLFFELIAASISIPLNVITAIGLWRYKNWARTLLIVGGFLVVGLALISGTAGLSTFLLFAIALYLLRPSVRAAFITTPAVQSRLLS